jgi:hypothetical protein
LYNDVSALNPGNVIVSLPLLLSVKTESWSIAYDTVPRWWHITIITAAGNRVGQSTVCQNRAVDSRLAGR